ncbi:phosphate ABC transporter substrate-binding protein PstS [Silvibacterium dinghuense]|uniref:Phosphate-binding protein n=1 Tax=Silvibacterium dinghuense TaxID=1560006 RepID=A0A4Q1SHQ3_9BACT|nr:phosphate ABC transporter substrate-binding protein PstS [Silvibacterium dinghuense]RXS96873.1 phosphate ABC transporter substrate-binding protein PstS [Silvibacterium dinghuense]GGG94341.1 phosphate-binding protein [Silvibacterium dinghuense]
MSRKPVALALLTLGAMALTACKSNTVALNGAGSTFVNPVMTRWVQEFSQSHPNIQINYQSIGSGAGVQQVKAGTVDFGASDAPLTDSALAAMQPVIQIPESAGPVCITYNLPGLTQPLQLSPESLAGIFLGTIKTWQDPRITADNPGVTLPKQNIAVVHRADGSGTTNAFTTYLSAISQDWQTKVGKGNSVSWPVGLGGKGSEGVTGQLRQSPGAIGYVELTYAQQNNLPVAKIKNQAGNYIAPTAQSTTSAINAFTDALSKDPRTPIVNPPAHAGDAYPISTLTFLIIPKDGTDKDKRAALKSFIQYIIGDGQSVSGTLNYAPLPDGVKQYDLQQLNQLTAGGQPLQ